MLYPSARATQTNCGDTSMSVRVALLALPQRLLGALALGHVHRGPDDLDGAAGRIEHRGDHGLEVPDRPVWKDESPLAGDSRSLADRSLDFFDVLARSSGWVRSRTASVDGIPASGSNPQIRRSSGDQCFSSLVSRSKTQLPV
jgi:hypothetical protein